MPSPINTGGFQVTNLPTINWLDPRLMVPDYTRVLTGVNQGLDTVKDVGAIRDQALARQQVEQTQAARIAALNAANQFTGAQSLANLQLLPQDTQLRAADTASKLSLLPSSTSAGIAANTLRGATDTAALPNVAPAAANEGKRLAIDSSNLGFKEGELPTLQFAEHANNQAGAITASAAPNLAAAKNTAAAGAVQGEISQQQLEALKNKADTINQQVANDLAAQRQQFITQHPEWNEDELQAKLLTSDAAVKGLQATKALNDQLTAAGAPDEYKQRALQNYSQTVAAAARAQTEASLGGLTPGEVQGQAKIGLEQAQARQAQAKALREEITQLGDLPAGPNQTIAQFVGDVADRKQKTDDAGNVIGYEWKFRDIKPGQHHPEPNPQRDAIVQRYIQLSNTLGAGAPDASVLPTTQPQGAGSTTPPPAALRSPGAARTSLLGNGTPLLRSISIAPPAPTPAPVPRAATAVQIPAAAIARLRANPGLAQDFQQAYGVDPAQYLNP